MFVEALYRGMPVITTRIAIVIVVFTVAIISLLLLLPYLTWHC